MKRSPIKRTKPLGARKPIRKRNPQRAASKYARNFLSRAFVKFVKMGGCCQSCGRVPTERRPCECSHAEPRGMGGCGAGWWRIFRQCSDCHVIHGAHKQRYSARDVERWILKLQIHALNAGVITLAELKEARHLCQLQQERAAA